MLSGSTFDLKYDEDNEVLWAACGSRLYAYDKTGTLLKNFAPAEYRIGSGTYLALISSITVSDGTLYYSVTDNFYTVGAVNKITYNTSSGFNYIINTTTNPLLANLESDTQLFALNVGGNEQLLIREYDYGSGEDTVAIYNTNNFTAPIYEEHGVTSNLHAAAVSGGNSILLAQYDSGQVSAMKKSGSTYAVDSARQYPPGNSSPVYPADGGSGGCDAGAGGMAVLILMSAAILKRRWK
jgi:hypothetical protein